MFRIVYPTRVSDAGETLEEVARRRPRARQIRPLVGLFPFLKPYWRFVVGAFVALVLATAILLIVPLAVRRAIDLGLSAEGLASAEGFGRGLILIAMVLATATATRFFLVSWIGERVVADLRSAVFDHVISLSPAFFEVNHTGEIQSRLTADTTLIKTVVGSTVSIALRNIFTFVGAVTMLVITNGRLALWILGSIALVALPLVGFGRLVRRLARKSQDRLADTGVFASEALGAVQTVQAFNHEAADRARYGEVVESAFRAARQRLWARSVLTAVVTFLMLSLLGGTVSLGAQAVAQGQVSVGELSQFVLYGLFCATSLMALTEVWGELQLAAGAAERLFELLRTPAQIRTPAEPQPLPAPPRGEICFEGVHFAYPTRPEAAALENFSLSVRPGETVALVGPSGAGKSTVFRLLLRFYDVDVGRICIDGVDVRDADLQAVRGRLALVPQETAIFSGSVSDNIRYGREQASDAEVEAAARVALADGFIRELRQGYATRLGEHGMTLSGGQRQRLAIARAVLRDAPILLLDEATSSLDSQSERLVQEAFGRLEAGRTILVIAHRLATVMAADRILVMDGGRVVAEGTHKQLLEHDSLYADLARLQFDTGAVPDVATQLSAR